MKVLQKIVLIALPTENKIHQSVLVKMVSSRLKDKNIVKNVLINARNVLVTKIIVLFVTEI